MRFRDWFCALSLGTSVVLLTTVTIAQDTPKPPVPNPPTKDDGIQIENRGPVHEAFANPGAPVRGKEGVFADKAPPPAVPELPPEEKPSGNNVQWIPGYWQWDLDKKDFLWVSGFWRNTPPGREWHAGEWTVENGKNRYIPGYWQPSKGGIGRTNLPEPPRSVENGPNVPAPHKDALWIPGRWVHREDNYVWQPGYWGEVEQDMVWTPGQYNYTGHGYCWVPGYWDYCFEDRGLLYAPVYFTRPLWLTAGWRFCPSFGISVGFGGGWAWGYGGFYDSLFWGPGYCSFWFGNYYGPGYWGCGFRPWCWNGGAGHCNPVYNHYCWANRNNPNWNQHMQQHYAAHNMGAMPGPGRNINGNSAAVAGNVSARTLNSATAMANRLGGEKAGQQFVDRVSRGQSIQQVNNALKQSGSSNVVQPANQVLKNQSIAQSLPTVDKSSARTIDTSSARSMSLNQQISNSIRTAPTGSTTYGDRIRGISSESLARSQSSSRTMSSRMDSFSGMDRSIDGRAFNSMSSSRGFQSGSSMSTRGSFSGNSNNAGSFRGGSGMSSGGFRGGAGMGGGMGGGGHGGGGGGGGRK